MLLICIPGSLFQIEEQSSLQFLAWQSYSPLQHPMTLEINTFIHNEFNEVSVSRQIYIYYLKIEFSFNWKEVCMLFLTTVLLQLDTRDYRDPNSLL